MAAKMSAEPAVEMGHHVFLSHDSFPTTKFYACLFNGGKGAHPPVFYTEAQRNGGLCGCGCGRTAVTASLSLSYDFPSLSTSHLLYFFSSCACHEHQMIHKQLC